MIRENRLYQADWLMRFYKFSLREIVDPAHPQLDLDIDPKLSWALRNLHQFPIDVNRADYEMILRVPGIGVQSALRIVQGRRYSRLGWDQLKQMGIAVSRAKHFIVCNSKDHPRDINEAALRQQILRQSKYAATLTPQLSIF
jgi:predicted DNA-binding helix-hairpin-helix protein